MIELSLVIPVYNEAENIETLAGRIEEAMAARPSDSWEAILVNDGSDDGSDLILDELAKRKPQFRPVHFVRNQGQTAAMDAGIRRARGRLLATMDADLQNDPKDIETLMDHLTDDVDCVCGVRVKRQDDWLRRLSSRIANGVRNWLSNETITDTGCSLKLFRTHCFDGVKLYEGMHRFLPTLVKLEGYRVIETPVGHHPRHAGESKYGVWNRVFKSFLDLLAVRWMKKRYLRYEVRDSQGK